MKSGDLNDLSAKQLARLPFFDTSNERELKVLAETEPEKMAQMTRALVIMKLPRILTGAGLFLGGLIGAIRGVAELLAR